MLSDEEKEEITGGVSVKETMPLTDEECKKLSEKILSNPDLFDAIPTKPVLIAYGCPSVFRKDNLHFNPQKNDLDSKKE